MRGPSWRRKRERKMRNLRSEVSIIMARREKVRMKARPKRFTFLFD
jgi:hypothetical protein